MTLSLLFWLTLAAAGVSFWWQSDRVRSFAYEHVLKENLSVTDETSALEAISVKTQLVASTSPNPKITTPADLATIST